MEYEIRKPKATDLPVACKILKGIGLKNIAKCFNNDDIEVFKKSISGKEVTDEMLNKAGLMVILSIGDLIFEKMEDIQVDLFRFISNLTGLKVKEVENLSLTDLANIVIAILKEPDFTDFIKVVLKLSK